jgi:hypothetical protein
MCGCDFNFVCSRCADTPQDWRYFDADDPRDVERERAERDEWLTLLARQLEAAGR